MSTRYRYSFDEPNPPVSRRVFADSLESGTFFFDEDGDLNLKIDVGVVCFFVSGNAILRKSRESDIGVVSLLYLPVVFSPVYVDDEDR